MSTHLDKLRAALTARGIDLDAPDADGLTLRALLDAKPAKRAAPAKDKPAMSPGEAFYFALGAARENMWREARKDLPEGYPASGVRTENRFDPRNGGMKGENVPWTRTFGYFNSLTRAETVWARVPAKLASHRFVKPDGSLSRPIKMPRDHALPAARYWPDGKLPEGIELADPALVYSGRGEDIWAHQERVMKWIRIGGWNTPDDDGERFAKWCADEMLDEQAEGRRRAERVRDADIRKQADDWRWVEVGDDCVPPRSPPF